MEWSGPIYRGLDQFCGKHWFRSLWPGLYTEPVIKLMLRKFQSLFGCLVGFTLVHAAAAFTVWGPVEAWQTPDLDYIDRVAITTLYGGSGVELGGDKVLAAGSRVGVPVITYA